MLERALISLLMVLSLASCSASGSQGVADQALTQCLDPRPQICTADYRPVCAVLADGRREEFSNGCSACSNPEVHGWIADPCSESRSLRIQ